MESPTIIYYGPTDLRSHILSAYFAKLHCPFLIATGLPDLLRTTRSVARPLVVLSDDQPPPTLLRIAGALIPDLRRPRPPIFILNTGKPFDAHLPAVTVLSGPRQLSDLVERLLDTWRRATAGGIDAPRYPLEEWERFRASRPNGDDPVSLVGYSVALRLRLRSILAATREIKSRARETRSVASDLRDSSLSARFYHQQLVFTTAEILKNVRRLRLESNSPAAE